MGTSFWNWRFLPAIGSLIKRLPIAKLTTEGVLVLGIQRNHKEYLGSPNGQTIVYEGDILSLYGQISRLEEIDLRKRGRAGDQAHQVAVKAQTEMVNAQDDSSDNDGQSGGDETSEPGTASSD